MCDCISSILIPCPGFRIQRLGLTRSNWRPRTVNIETLNNFKSISHVKVSRNPGALVPSDDYEFYSELEFKEDNEKRLESGTKTGSGSGIAGSEPIEDASNRSTGNAALGSTGMEFLELKASLDNQKKRKKVTGSLNDDEVNLVAGCANSKPGESVQLDERAGLRSGKQLMRRSNLLAKQVISVQSALCFGFISQLWVDTNSWVVLVVEVKPNLLSGEVDRFFLEDVIQIGDVVLVQDESVMTDYKMVGLETLVGYNVITPGQQTIGKVRGYTFNINSGAVEFLELDSFGFSIIPSSLVSTYALFVEDVLEVMYDKIVVHEAAASRIQRLTKGFCDTQNVGKSMEELTEYSDTGKQPAPTGHSRSARRSFRSRRLYHKDGDMGADWELPMDYF